MRPRKPVICALFLTFVGLALPILAQPYPSQVQAGSISSEPQDSNAPPLRSTTSEVLLDFVVRDKHANIIRDLRPEEVQILEDGIPQTQRYFQFVDKNSKEPASTAPATAASPALETTVEPKTVNELRDISVVTVVIGNLDPRGRELTLKAMRDFAKYDLGPHTYVGVFTLGMGGLRNLQAYTNDASQVAAAVEKAVSNALVGQFSAVDSNAMGFGGMGAVSESADVTPPFDQIPNDRSRGTQDAAKAIARLLTTKWVNEMHDVYMGSRLYLSPLRVLVDAQAEIPGRKVMLLFSAGILVQADTVELLRSIISAANRSNVSIYALDSQPQPNHGQASGKDARPPLDPLQSDFFDARRRLATAANASMNVQLGSINGATDVTPDQVLAMEIAETAIHSDTRGNMKGLAEGTGGAMLPDTLDLREPLREAIESSRTHYEVTYSPVNTSLDGSFRNIQVKVTRPGATVFARSGYYAVPLVNGRQVYPFEVATLKAINIHPDLHQFEFHATTLEFRPGPVQNQYAFIFQAPTKELTVTTDEKWAKVHVCVTALIRDDKGQVVEKISKDIPYEGPLARKVNLEAGTVSFTTPFYLAPGHYTIDTASVDRQSMKASVSRSTLDVEPDSGFAMSDVAVARRVDDVHGPGNTSDPLESRGGKVTPELSDLVAPDANGNLKFFAVAYPSAPVDAKVIMKAEILQDNKVVARSPVYEVPLDLNGAASILASVPAARLPAAQYEAEVSFQYKGEKLTKNVKFTLAGGA